MCSARRSCSAQSPPGTVFSKDFQASSLYLGIGHFELFSLCHFLPPSSTEFPGMLSLPIGSASNFVTNIHDKPPVLTGVVFICSFFWKEKEDLLSDLFIQFRVYQ